MKIKFYGVRGSMAQAHRDYMVYGGNTSSVVMRTPANSLIFLDAGTGIQYAAREELAQPAEKVFLGLSHTHADHTQGLGMSPLPWVNFRQWYNGKQAQLMGPPGVVEGLQQFYDGVRNWPVRATDDPNYKNPKMPGITLGFAGKAWELEDGKTYEIDSITTLKTMRGNHPVDGSSIFYRFECRGKSFVYATDNEFDYVNGPTENDRADELKKRYRDFTKNADVLVADSQYTKEEYLNKSPSDVRGFGHAYIDQVVELSQEAGVRKVFPFHHHTTHTDSIMEKIESDFKELLKRSKADLEIEFAKEGTVVNLGENPDLGTLA